jgi:hypothetical protein
MDGSVTVLKLYFELLTRSRYARGGLLSSFFIFAPPLLPLHLQGCVMNAPRTHGLNPTNNTPKPAKRSSSVSNQQSLNHLLNFSLPPRVQHVQATPRRSKKAAHQIWNPERSSIALRTPLITVPFLAQASAVFVKPQAL